MPKATHAAERAPQQAEVPKATLSQLGELIALMDKGKIERDYMQDFLRRRLFRRPRAMPLADFVQPESPLVKVEEFARQHYPGVVNEVLGILAPWCDPHLDLEFKAFRGKYEEPITTMHSSEWEETQEVREALFWVSVKSIQPLFLGNGYEEFGPNTLGESFGNLTGQMFVDVFRTYGHLTPGFDLGANKIMHGHDCPGWYGLYKHIDEALKRTGAMRYGLFNPFRIEHSGVLHSITTALEKAIVLASKGDEQRLVKVLKFLEYQRSGRPVCHYHDGVAYVLGAKRR